MDEFQANFGQSLKHDLRQDRAKLIGDSLEGIHLARRNKDFPTWFEELLNLKSDVFHKFVNKDKETYKNMENLARKIINDYSFAFQSKKADKQSRGKIEEILRVINEFLIEKMDHYKFFGRPEYTEQL